MQKKGGGRGCYFNPQIGKDWKTVISSDLIKLLYKSDTIGGNINVYDLS